jgi:hypothetical protein
MIHTVSRLKTFFWVAIGGMSVLFGAENWSSFDTIIVSRYGGPIPYPYYQDYTSPSSNSVPNICSGILNYDHPSYGMIPIGGFDMRNGFVINSYFAEVGAVYTANTGAGTNPGNSRYCYWEVFYDYNGDGILGTQEAGYIDNRAKQLDASKFSITNFTPYGTSATFEFHMIDPTVVLPVGSIDVNRVATTNFMNLSVTTSGTFEGALSLQYKDSLTNTTWKFHSIHDIPAYGAVVPVADTNTVPARFYRAVVPK